MHYLTRIDPNALLRFLTALLSVIAQALGEPSAPS